MAQAQAERWKPDSAGILIPQYGIRVEDAVKQVQTKGMAMTENMEQIYRQVDGIFALEGFQVTETVRKVRAAVAAGKITDEAFRREFLDYVKRHKSTEGFIESRTWTD